jgi:Flp pilus assembly protein TadG
MKLPVSFPWHLIERVKQLRLDPDSFRKSEKGVAAIEAAFIFPFLFLLYFGMLDTTSYVSLNRKVSQSANVIADTIAQGTINTNGPRGAVTKAQVESVLAIVDKIVLPKDSDFAAARVTRYTHDGAGSPIAGWSVSRNAPTCGSTPTAAELTPLMEADGKRNDVIVATVCMNYVAFMGSFMGLNTTAYPTAVVDQTIILRPRSTATLVCNDC